MTRPPGLVRRRVGPSVQRIVAVAFAWLVVGSSWASQEPTACTPSGPSTDWIAGARSLIATLEPDLALPSALLTSGEFDALRIVLDGRIDDPRDDETLARRAVLELASAYGVPPFRTSDGGGEAPSPLIDDDTWLRRAADRVRAVGIAVRTSLPDGKIVAVGAYWSTPIMDRLRVVRVDQIDGDGSSLEHVRDGYLSALSTCAVVVEEWIELTDVTARTFLRAGDESWMFSFAPARAGDTMWSRWIPGPRIESALAFQDGGVRTEQSYSALFAGRTPSLLTVLANLTTVRSSMSVQELAAFVRGLF